MEQTNSSVAWKRSTKDKPAGGLCSEEKDRGKFLKRVRRDHLKPLTKYEGNSLPARPSFSMFLFDCVRAASHARKKSRRNPEESRTGVYA